MCDVFFGTMPPRGFSLGSTVGGVFLIRFSGRELHDLLTLAFLGLFHGEVAFAQDGGLIDALPPRPFWLDIMYFNPLGLDECARLPIVVASRQSPA